MNRCIFMGNLVRDVELKEVGSSKVASFTIAVSRFFKKQNGEKGKETSFLDMEAWDSGGEQISKFFRKGSPILVECSVKQETWEDKGTGSKRSRIKFRVDKFYFVGKKDSSEGDETPNDNPEDNGSTNTKPDDDAPF